MSNPPTLFDIFGIPDDGTYTEIELYETVKDTLKFAGIRLNFKIAELFAQIGLALPRYFGGALFLRWAKERWWCQQLLFDLCLKYGVEADTVGIRKRL